MFCEQAASDPVWLTDMIGQNGGSNPNCPAGVTVAPGQTVVKVG